LYCLPRKQSSARRGSSSFAFVYWIDENEYSIEPSESVMNTNMLTNPTLQGLVKHTGCKEPALDPHNGWGKYPGIIISTRGMLHLLHCHIVH